MIVWLYITIIAMFTMGMVVDTAPNWAIALLNSIAIFSMCASSVCWRQLLNRVKALEDAKEEDTK